MFLGCERRDRPATLTPNISTAVQNPQTTSNTCCLEFQQSCLEFKVLQQCLVSKKTKKSYWTVLNKEIFPLKFIKTSKSERVPESSDSQTLDDKLALIKMKRNKKHEYHNENKPIETFHQETQTWVWKWQPTEGRKREDGRKERVLFFICFLSQCNSF